MQKAVLLTVLLGLSMRRCAENVTAQGALWSDHINDIAVNHSRALSHALRPRYARLLEVLNSGGHAEVIAIGGSIPAGRSCNSSDERASRTECAYPARFSAWLSSYYCLPIGNLGFSNRATGGTTTAGSLPQLPELLLQDRATLGLLLVDFGLNDMYTGQYDESKHHHRAIDADNADVSTSPVAGATEALLLHILSHTSLAVVLIEGSCASESVASHRAHQRVASWYGVPMLSYTAALNPKLAHICGRGGTGRAVWASAHKGTHPGAGTHRLIADAMSLWWKSFASTLEKQQFAQTEAQLLHTPLPPPLVEQHVRERFFVCERSRTTYDAVHSFACGASGSLHDTAVDVTYSERCRVVPLPRVVNGSWTLVEDRVGKPGWITSGPRGARIEFDLEFGLESAMATIVYDTSYEGFGRVALTASYAPGMALVLDGLAPTGSFNVTQTEVLSLNFRRGIDLYPRPGHIPPLPKVNMSANSRSRITLALTLLSDAPSKFKVRHVASC